MNDKPHLIHETLITLKELSRRLPSSRPGRSVHINSIRRWAIKGILGVVLGTATVGGTVYTSEQELDRWRKSVQRKRASLRETPEALKRFQPRNYRRQQIRDWAGL